MSTVHAIRTDVHDGATSRSGGRPTAIASASPAAAPTVQPHANTARTSARWALAAALARAESFDEIVLSLYTGLEPLFGRIVMGFDLLEPETRRLVRTSGHGVSAYFLARYDRIARDDDPVLDLAITSRTVAHNLSMMSETEWRSLAVYREAFSLHRLTVVACAPVIAGDQVVGTLNLGREEGGEPFTDAQLREAADIANLLGELLEVLDRTDQLRRDVEQYETAFELSGEPIVITDMQRGLRRTNAAAGSLLESLPPSARSLDEELAQSMVSPRNGRPLADTIVKHTSMIQDGTAHVSLLRSAAAPCRLPRWLELSLTAREADVVVLAAQGYHDAEIAEQLLLSIHTVKGYLREAYRKAGVRSRLDFARLLPAP
ncbi:LuxR C-terminal-related transcriptional regulator [Nitriliruptor alkaliphilus]|uniref:LuxR C-terminal-related transcriptional regulator n=1 Tax=Nitriliruptor alkaliphilus TaxID=427918 RepID=UPI00069885D8|nr:LuxR C-terminal-related transcriptional regulator [Nitriliruptor alkaliphilus]